MVVQGIEQERVRPSSRKGIKTSTVPHVPTSLDLEGGTNSKRSLPIPLAVVDLTTGYIKTRNRAFEKLIGPFPIQLTSNEDISRELNEKPNSPIRIEIPCPAKEGNFLEVFLYAVHYKDKKSILATTVDITERKEGEQNLRDEVAELRLLRKEAGDLNHDVRNQLTTANIAIQILDRQIGSTLDPYTKNLMEQLKRAVGGAIKTTMGISSLSAAEITQREPFNIACLIQKSLDNYEYLLNINGIEVKTAFSGVPVVSVNGSQMERVFNNLIVNAIHAMSSQPIKKLSLSCELQDREIIIKISDTGCGIPNEIKEEIWKEGFTTKAGTVFHGTGHGLANVKRVVETHRGRISAETRNPGTTFTIILPLAN